MSNTLDNLMKDVLPLITCYVDLVDIKNFGKCCQRFSEIISVLPTIAALIELAKKRIVVALDIYVNDDLVKFPTIDPEINRAYFKIVFQQKNKDKIRKYLHIFEAMIKENNSLIQYIFHTRDINFLEEINNMMNIDRMILFNADHIKPLLGQKFIGEWYNLFLKKVRNGMGFDNIDNLRVLIKNMQKINDDYSLKALFEVFFVATHLDKRDQLVMLAKYYNNNPMRSCQFLALYLKNYSLSDYIYNIIIKLQRVRIGYSGVMGNNDERYLSEFIEMMDNTSEVRLLSPHRTRIITPFNFKSSKPLLLFPRESSMPNYTPSIPFSFCASSVSNNIPPTLPNIFGPPLTLGTNFAFNPNSSTK